MQFLSVQFLWLALEPWVNLSTSRALKLLLAVPAGDNPATHRTAKSARSDASKRNEELEPHRHLLPSSLSEKLRETSLVGENEFLNRDLEREPEYAFGFI